MTTLLLNFINLRCKSFDMKNIGGLLLPHTHTQISLPLRHSLRPSQFLWSISTSTFHWLCPTQLQLVLQLHQFLTHSLSFCQFS